MKRHRRRTRRLLMTVGLGLWAGLLVVLILSQERMADVAGVDPVIPGLNTQEQATQQVDAPASDAPQASAERPDESPAVVAEGDQPRKDNTVNEPPEPVEPDQPERDRASADADAPSAAVSATDEEAIDPADEAPARITADMARLETPDEAANGTSGNVVRAQFTTAIDEREPVNKVETVFSMHGRVFSLDGRPLSAIFYFTELKGMRGETVTHRWMHEGQEVGQSSFTVDGDPSRIYSSKALEPAMQGRWSVLVTDAEGNVIHTDSFMYQGS